MSLLREALSSHKQEPEFPGEQVYLAVEEFFDTVNSVITTSIAEGKCTRYLSLEDGTVCVSDIKTSASLALEELTGSAIAIIAAIGIAIAALMYKLYKHFFGDDKNVADDSKDLADIFDGGIPEVAASIDTTQDAINTVQDSEKKRDLNSQLNAAVVEFEETISNNVKFAILADNRGSKKFINYHRHLVESIEKLSTLVGELDNSIEKGVDLIKGITGTPNSAMANVLNKERQMLSDRIDMYHGMALKHNVDKTLDNFNHYKQELEKSKVPPDFIRALKDRNAKAFITGILRDESMNLMDMEKRLNLVKKDIEQLRTISEKYDKLDADFIKNATFTSDMADYFAVLKEGMATVKYHAKLILTTCKTEDLLYRVARDCVAAIAKFEIDKIEITATFSEPEVKSGLKKAKESMSAFFSKLRK